MKKSLKIAIATVLVLIFAILVTGCGLKISTGEGNYIGLFYLENYQEWDNEFAPEGSYIVPASDIDNLDLKWMSGNIDIVIYDGKDIIFTESAEKPIERDTALRYGIKDKTLYIQFCPKNQDWKLSDLQNIMPNKDLQVKIPAGFAASLHNFSCESDAADLNVPELTAQSFVFDSASGNLQAADMDCGKVNLDNSSGNSYFAGKFAQLDADSASGNIKLDSTDYAESAVINNSSGQVDLAGKFKKLSIDTASGDVKTESTVVADSLSVGSSSGIIWLNGSFEQVNINNSSGDVYLGSTLCPAVLNISNSSGSVTLALPENSAFTLGFDTGSGKIQSDLPLVLKSDKYILGSGAAPFSVNTASGDLILKTAK